MTVTVAPPSPPSTAVSPRTPEASGYVGNLVAVDEEVTVTDLQVTGTIPAQLDGRFVRNGPNPVGGDVPASLVGWGLQPGMLHGVRLRDGRAEWYRNRLVRNAAISDAYGEPTHPGRRHAGIDAPPNTNVIRHAGRTLALVEGGPSPYELTDDLDTAGPCSFESTLVGGFTAHPTWDPTTGDLHAICYFAGQGDRVRHTVVDRFGRVGRSTLIETDGQPMIHDNALTERFVIVLDLPVKLDPAFIGDKVPARLARPVSWLAGKGMARGLPEPLIRPFAGRFGRESIRTIETSPYRWMADRPGRIGLVPKGPDGGETRWFEVSPCFVFHTLNAYEDGDTVVLDVVRYDRLFVDGVVDVDCSPTLDRWTLDLATGTVTEERLDDRPQEFPRIDERGNGRRHAVGFSASFGDPSTGHLGGTSILRHDLVAGTTQVRDFGAGRFVGEFVFVPNGPDAIEADGVLMGYVHDAAVDRSELAIVDAATLDDVAVVHLPVRIPEGFHGNWLRT